MSSSLLVPFDVVSARSFSPQSRLPLLRSPLLCVTPDSVPASTPPPTPSSTPAPTPVISPAPASAPSPLMIPISSAFLLMTATVNVAIFRFVFGVVRIIVMGFICHFLIIFFVDVDAYVTNISAGAVRTLMVVAIFAAFVSAVFVLAITSNIVIAVTIMTATVVLTIAVMVAAVIIVVVVVATVIIIIGMILVVCIRAGYLGH